jgi:hypothetical protein
VSIYRRVGKCKRALSAPWWDTKNADDSKEAPADADLLLAKDAEPVLRQVLTVSPGVQEFVKAITKKHLQR